MKINTDVLKESLDFLSMGISKAASSPTATKLIELSTHEGKLYGYTYDEVNFLRVKICDTTEDFNVVLTFDVFNSLVSSCKDDEIELIIEKKGVKFKTKTMSCKLANYLQTASTSPVKHPLTTLCDKECTEDIGQYMSAIKSILNKNHVITCYQNIYFGDAILATDTDNALIINKQVFTEDLLLSYHSVEILNSLGNFNYAIKTENGWTSLYVKTENKVLYITTFKRDEYQYNDFKNLLKVDIPNAVDIEKTDLNNGLSTASLFQSANIDIVMSKDGVSLVIPSDDFNYKISTIPCEDFSYRVPIATVKRMLCLDQKITLFYGNKDFIKIYSGDYKELLGVV